MHRSLAGGTQSWLHMVGENSTLGQASIACQRYYDAMDTTPHYPNGLDEPYTARMLRVADYIAAHLSEPLNPTQLADIAALSRYHFHRTFRGMTGESVMQFVRRLRLERAARHLKHGAEKRVTEVAFSSGYHSHAAFTRAFSTRFGMAPTDFQQQESDTPQECIGKVITMRARRLVCLNRVGPYSDVGESWETLLMWAAEEGLMGSHFETIGISHDDPDITDPSRLRYDACITIGNGITPQVDGLRMKTIPAGRFAVAKHLGPYDEISTTYYALLGGFVPQAGLRLADEPPFEIYWNSPDEVDPEELDTDICLRLEG